MIYIFKKEFYIFQSAFIYDHFSTKIITQNIFSDVVISWAKAAGNEDNLGIFCFKIQCILYFVSIVTNRNPVFNGYSNFIKLLLNPGAVCVYYLPNQQFIADGYNGSINIFHGAKLNQKGFI